MAFLIVLSKFQVLLQIDTLPFHSTYFQYVIPYLKEWIAK